MLAQLEAAAERSGVARVRCALGQEILLRHLSTKTTEFEVKNRRKSAEFFLRVI